MKEFLLTRARALEAAANKQVVPLTGAKPSKRNSKKEDVSTHATTAGSEDRSISCPECREKHPLRACSKFKALTAEQRRDLARKKRACFNCLGQGHQVGVCPSSNRCRQCQEKHHSLLHLTESSDSNSQLAVRDTKQASSSVAETTPTSEATTVINHASSINRISLLATVRVVNDSGRSMTVRALLDTASEASFVTERVAQQLRLSRRQTNVAVSGLQNVRTGRTRQFVSVVVGTERSPSFRLTVPRVYVLPSLTASIPGKQIPHGNWPHLKGLQLADPDYATPARVDMILGAGPAGLLFNGGVKHGPPGTPSAHSTACG